MEMLVYLLLAAIAYGIVAARSDRSVDRIMQSRQDRQSSPRLVDDLHGPAIPSGDRRVIRPNALHRHKDKGSA
jgi:hypothetical protein